ncbi:hypothetical protein ACROYT_G035568 [Oculina patagonica]
MADPFATSTDITASERIMLETSVMELLEPEPGSMPSEMQAAGPDIPALREQLARLVSTGKSKEAIGVQLTHEQVKRLTEKDVEKYFKRRILFQMGGIQSVSALPGDPTFSQFDNKYDVASYKRICAEFGVDPSSDFRFTRGANHGLGDVYIWFTNIGPKNSGAKYPDYDKFSDEGGAASKGNLIQYIEPDDAAYAQADWFCPNAAEGLTQAGLSRVNQSIEAFVYCILGSQVNVRSSILGTGGRAKEAQSEFLVLVEDAIRQPDLAKSVQRYQLSIDEAKVRLNLAVCPGAWLMPGSMVINTESVVGYNNQLKQAVAGIKIGLNNDVNKSTKKAALKLMAGGPSKVNPPNSHPSNPIHKESQRDTKKTPAPTSTEGAEAESAQSAKATKVEVNDTHEINKATIAVGAVGAAALLYALMR